MNDDPDSDAVTIAADGISATISPDGAELRRLRDEAGRDLLWDGDPAFWTGRAPVLFPIVGGLNGDTYRLGDERHGLPKHGFARRSRFALIEATGDLAIFRLDASAETLAVYPFDFGLKMRFAVQGATIEMTATIENRGPRAMPASFGFHPALRWPLPYGRPRAAHRILFDRDEPGDIRRIDTSGLLEAAPRPTPVTGGRMPLADDLFVEDAVIFDRLSGRSLRYGADEGPQLLVEYPCMPLLGIWTKPGAGFLCIEPWQGIADPIGYTGDFTAKPGVISIPPGAAHDCMMRITIEAT